MTSLILYQQQPSTLSQLINQGPALSMYVSACHKLLISKYKNGAAICETAPLQITAGYLTLHREKLGLQLNTHMAVTTGNRHQPLRMPQIQATGCSKAPATYLQDGRSESRYSLEVQLTSVQKQTHLLCPFSFQFSLETI